MSTENVKKAIELLKIAQGFISESTGLAGWHLNGAVAEWGEIEMGDVIDEAVELLEAPHD